MKRGVRRGMLAIVCVAALGAPAQAVTNAVVDTGKLRFAVNRDGGGFIDEILYDGRLVASFRNDLALSPPGYDVSPEARQLADAIAARLKKNAVPADVVCTLTRGQTRHGHDRVTIANGYLRVSVVPQVGGRIIEMTDLITGRNQFQDTYSSLEKLPDLTKKREFLGGFEDNIDRHDIAWRTPYEVQTLVEKPDEVSIVARADVENPGEGGRKLRIERTMRLVKGSPVLWITLRYTALGGAQNVKIMPHPRPFAGEAPDTNDTFYVSSRGEVVRSPVTDKQGDVYVPLGADDHWAAICDIRDRHTLVNTFSGPLELIDIYVDKGAYTLEPYTPQIEGIAEGGNVTMNLAYWSCYNMDAVHFASETLAGQLLLQRDAILGDEPLRAKIALVGTRVPEPIRLAPKILDAGGRLVSSLPPFTVQSAFLAAQPTAQVLAVKDLPEGRYTLAVDLVRGTNAVGQMRAAFVRLPARGCFIDGFVPAETNVPVRLAVLGRRVPGAPSVETIERTVDGDTSRVKIAGTFTSAPARQPLGRFETTLSAVKGGSTIEVAHTLIPEGPDGGLVSEWACRLPLILRGKPTQIRTIVGNDHKFLDVWRLDSTDEYYPSYLLSDVMRWPRWGLGGLLVDSPTHYAIWKSNRADTSPTVTYEGVRSPGWLDVSDADWGVTTVFSGDVMAQAPKAIVFDAESGDLKIALHPAEAAPLAVAGQGAAGATLARGQPATVRFSLEFHDGRHPTRMPLELTDSQYRLLIESVRSHWTLASAMWQAGLKSEGTPEERIERLLRADMPPSGILRSHSGLLSAAMKVVAGFVPSADSEDNIRRLLHYYRTGEILPAR